MENSMVPLRHARTWCHVDRPWVVGAGVGLLAFVVFDLSGRTVLSGRLQSQNVLNLPMGNYVLSLPSLGVQQLLPQLH